MVDGLARSVGLVISGTPAPSVATGRDEVVVRDFVSLAGAVYARDPLWVRPFERSLYRALRNPPQTDGRRQELFVVRHGRRPGARACAWSDAISRAAAKGPTGYFSHFEAHPDADAVHALFDAVRAWLRAEGITHLIGPKAAGMMEPPGVLVEGRGRPVSGTPYNPPYYPGLLSGVGLEKYVDLLDFTLPIASGYPRITRLAGLARARFPRARVRPVDLKEGFEADVHSVVEVYNAAWAHNWGFVELTVDRLMATARELRPVYRPEYAMLLELDGRCIGFAMMMPDFNEVFHRIRGRLLPTGWFHLLFGMRRIRTFRAFFIGLLPQYRSAGLEAVLIEALLRVIWARRVDRLHVGWIKETNYLWRNEVSAFAGVAPGTAHKRYRLYSGE